MSRGGRGGGFGGRGGLKGATWEHDPSINLDNKPSDLFPAHPNIKRAEPISEREFKQVSYFKDMRRTIKQGPYYTESTKRNTDINVKIFGEDQFNKQYGSKSAADFDPFTGVETYSMQYTRPKRTIPDLSTRILNKDFFPSELWPTITNPTARPNQTPNRIQKKKATPRHNTAATAKAETALEIIDKMTAGGEGGAEGEMEDAEEEEVEEVDNDYEEDDEDMGGDYDGEQYFDNGEGEDYDEGEGGGDDY